MEMGSKVFDIYRFQCCERIFFWWFNLLIIMEMGSKVFDFQLQGFVFFFLFLVYNLITLEAASKELCSPFSCGNLKNISYPFSNSSTIGCGLSVIECVDNTPLIQFQEKGKSYEILAISDRNNTIVIRDKNVVSLTQGVCKDVFYNFSEELMLSSLPFDVISPHLIILQCSNASINLPYYKYSNCNDTSLFYYDDSIPNDPVSPAILQKCDVSRFPAMNNLSLFNDESSNNAPNTQFWSLLKAGFSLRWKLPADGAVNQEKKFRRNKEKKFRRSHAIGVFSGVGGSMLLILCLWFVYRKNQRKRRGTTAKNVELFLESYGCGFVQRYTYKDIKKMTNSFEDKLGQGGYGMVFKGKLVDGRLVAVKLLINDSRKSTNGGDFINEVATIGKTNHVNVVTLLGYCSSGSRRALVYELMFNGSLDKFIYAKKEKSTTTMKTTTSGTIATMHPLGWEKLYQIALGIARGLEYLHRGCNIGRILHFDIKPHNILLDEIFCPKISDFGLAKLYPSRESGVSMLSGGRGTMGYIAPEVYNRSFGVVSYKSDVYSYGMMVLEMVGGRQNIDPFVENTSEIYFPHWIYNRMEKQKDNLESLLRFEEVFEVEIGKKMIMVGLWCIQTHPTNRPSMGRVTQMLEGSIQDLPMPPNPFVDSCLPLLPPTI